MSTAANATYQLERPARPLPLLVEVPHAGTLVPESVREWLDVNPREVRRDADLFVDELFRSAPARGAVLLTAKVSRYVVDLNRFEHDVDAAVVPGLPCARPNVPRGLVWRETTEGRSVLKRPLTAREFDERLEQFYFPYHRCLAAELEALRDEFGYVVLVSGHSMPSVGRAGHGDEGRRRADVVPGTRGRSTAAGAVIDAVDTHFRAAGLSLRHDDPYRGGATTIRWGRVSDGIHAVQIELNRGLYMDEYTAQPKPEGFRWLASLCDSLIERLARLKLSR